MGQTGLNRLPSARRRAGLAAVKQTKLLAAPSEQQIGLILLSSPLDAPEEGLKSSLPVTTLPAR